MNYLYLSLNLGSILVPFLFSFHPKLKFYQYWKSLSKGIIISMLVFIPWDVLFTLHGVWGFNEDYFLGVNLLSLPIEEWLFFICIPYACVFTHYALIYYLPQLKLSIKASKIISYVFIILFSLLSVYNFDKWYTFVNFALATILLILVVKKNVELLQSYFLTFLIMLVPFFIVNGILTGSFIENQVVWYNDSENLGVRLFTIPIEDTVYAFTLILLSLFVMSRFDVKKSFQ